MLDVNASSEQGGGPAAPRVHQQPHSYRPNDGAPVSESAASHAVRWLRAHRIVSPRRQGRMMYYRLGDAHVRMLLDLALAHTQHTVMTHPEREQA
jgi:DNA-binding transcriptional ArsR family regulator